MKARLTNWLDRQIRRVPRLHDWLMSSWPAYRRRELAREAWRAWWEPLFRVVQESLPPVEAWTSQHDYSVADMFFRGQKIVWGPSLDTGIKRKVPLN